jgi:hypothetical protein
MTNPARRSNQSREIISVLIHTRRDITHAGSSPGNSIPKL